MRDCTFQHSVESIVLDTESVKHVACNRQARPRQCTPFRFIRGATIDYRGTIEGSIEAKCNDENDDVYDMAEDNNN